MLTFADDIVLLVEKRGETGLYAERNGHTINGDILGKSSTNVRQM